MRNIEEIIEQLREWRENCVRNPEALRDLFDKLPSIEKNLKVEEKWTVVEQFCMAGIDLHDDKMISTCLKRLNAQFPGSNRVRLLNVIAEYEVPGKYNEAIDQYDEMIDEDDTNTSARKRKIAVLISQNKIVDAIRELCDYLRRFMNDQEAWKELCELYMLEQDYQKAVFCMEEVLLSQPQNHIYHTRLAEMHYTVGTFESMELARSYYHQAVKLNDTNVRALHGLHLSLKFLLATNKLNGQQRKDYEELNTKTKASVNSIYDKSGHPDIAKFMKIK